MSEYVDVEWFGRDHKIGIVLTYDDHDGFKCRMAPLPEMLYGYSETMGARWIMEYAAKIPFEWAWGIFGKRMKSEWLHRHLADDIHDTVRYDHRDYDVNTLEEIK